MFGALLKISLGFLFLFGIQAYSQSYFSDDFESGISKWNINKLDGQDWDTTAACSHSGNHCITDSPFGDYLRGTSSWIETKKAINLENAKNPVLSFWHKFETEYYVQSIDYCRVEVSTNNGFSWTELASYSGTQNTWTNETISLKKYSNKSITIKFKIIDSYSHKNENKQADGWYVDDVEVKELTCGKTIETPFHEGFENGLDNWLISGFDWGLTKQQSHTGIYSITESPQGKYDRNSKSILALADYFYITPSPFPIITFWHKYNLNNKSDFCYFEISEDCGLTWSQVKKYTGDQNTWKQERINLYYYRGKNIKIRFRLESSNVSPEDGWYIDDIDIINAEPKYN